MANGGENPIKRAGQDKLLRKAGAQSLASDLRDVDASEGYVLGVVGPWGTGKTSIINMIREALAEEPPLPVVEFNPWIFSGTDELVDAFFRELAAQMRLKGPKLAAIADTVNTYGDLLSPISALPFLGGWFERVRGATKAIKDYQEKRKGSIKDQRDKLAAELEKLEQPIVVVIDDIDRLESSEIRDIFKLVRLTASFPNIIYLLAFDRIRVEQALSQSGFDGRAYLEKIVQLGIDVPVAPSHLMLRLIGESLGEALDGLPANAQFDESAWPDILMEVIRPLIRNVRDVHRYSVAVRAKARALGPQVELVDVLGLEAIRVFLPDVFAAVVAGRDGLTSPSSPGLGRQYEEPNLKEQVEFVMTAGSTHPEVVRALVTRMFPAAQRHIGGSHYDSGWLSTWLKERRVAHSDVLAMYLEQASNQSLEAFDVAEQAFAVLSDQPALNALLRSQNPERLEDMVAALEAFEGDYPTEAVVPASRVLLNLLPDMPHRPRGMSFVDARLVVVRVVLRLLRRLESEELVLAATQEILAEVPSLASRFELITIVGHMENAGHKLVAKEDAEDLEHDLWKQVRETPPEQLATERDVLLLLYMPKRFGEGEVILADPSCLSLARALLLDARSTVTSQTMGSRQVWRTTRLNYDMLVEVMGGEEALKHAIDAMRGSDDAEFEELIALADRYLSGWRPSEWGED